MKVMSVLAKDHLMNEAIPQSNYDSKHRSQSEWSLKPTLLILNSLNEIIYYLNTSVLCFLCLKSKTIFR